MKAPWQVVVAYVAVCGVSPLGSAAWNFDVTVTDRAGRPVEGAQVRMYMIKSDLSVSDSLTDGAGRTRVTIDISRPPLDCTPLRVFLSAEKNGYLGAVVRMNGKPRGTYTLAVHKDRDARAWLRTLGELGLDVLDFGMLFVPYSAPIKPLFTGNPADAAPPGVKVQIVEGIGIPTFVINGMVIFGDRDYKSKLPPGSM
jgi:hypothetical protein